MGQLREFREFVRTRKPKMITFLSENQDEYDPTNPCEVDLRFTDVVVGESPNAIYLKGGMSSMCINRVRNVDIDENATPLGTLIRVRCTNPFGKYGELTYTMIAAI